MKATDKVLDSLTRKHTAFASFAALIDTQPDYFPTLSGKGEAKILADAYDCEMERRGDPRRAWKGLRVA